MNINISQVHQCCHHSKLAKTALEPVKKQLKSISRTFRISDTEAALLSVIILEAGKEGLCLGNLGAFLGLESNEFNGLFETVRSLVRCGYIRFKEKPRGRRRGLRMETEICLVPGLSDALEQDDLSLLKPQPIRTLGTLLEAWESLVSMRKEKIISFTEFVYRTSTLSARARSVEAVKLLDKMDVHGIERVFLFSAILEFCTGNNTFDGFAHIREITQDEPDIRMACLNNLSAEKGRFLSLKLVSLEVDDIMMEDERFVPGTALLPVLPAFAKRRKKMNSNLYRVISPEDIAPVEMCYDDDLRASVRKLSSVMEPANFDRLRERMRKHQLRNGLTVMLHGASGTGKTETVLQVARGTGRRILIVDAAQIQNAFVGVAEKNVRELFAEYNRMYRSEPVTPILLFNEADALLQKRRAINIGLDAHDNALQNILLEELEMFEGIFIGTTNLLTNMDAAFERRFLYRLEFRSPSPATRAHLLGSKFPGLEKEAVERLSLRHPLTGSQIENARRKVAIDEVLDPDFKLTEEVLQSYLSREVKTDGGLRPMRTIGFRYDKTGPQAA